MWKQAILSLVFSSQFFSSHQLYEWYLLMWHFNVSYVTFFFTEEKFYQLFSAPNRFIFRGILPGPSQREGGTDLFSAENQCQDYFPRGKKMSCVFSMRKKVRIERPSNFSSDLSSMNHFTLFSDSHVKTPFLEFYRCLIALHCRRTGTL